MPRYSLPPLATSGDNMRGPTPASNWVVKGQVAAGAYPGVIDDGENSKNLIRLLKAGFTTYVCVMAEVDMSAPEHLWRSQQVLRPYLSDIRRLLEEDRSRRQFPEISVQNLCYLQLPIRGEAGVLCDERLISFLTDCTKRVYRGEKLYIHCETGAGRTGLLVACMLGRLYGLKPTEALDLTQMYFSARQRKCCETSPACKAQRNQVRRILDEERRVRAALSTHSDFTTDTATSLNTSFNRSCANMPEAPPLPCDINWQRKVSRRKSSASSSSVQFSVPVTQVIPEHVDESSDSRPLLGGFPRKSALRRPQISVPPRTTFATHAHTPLKHNTLPTPNAPLTAHTTDRFTHSPITSPHLDSSSHASTNPPATGSPLLGGGGPSSPPSLPNSFLGVSSNSAPPMFTEPSANLHACVAPMDASLSCVSSPCSEQHLGTTPSQVSPFFVSAPAHNRFSCPNPVSVRAASTHSSLMHYSTTSAAVPYPRLRASSEPPSVYSPTILDASQGSSATSSASGGPEGLRSISEPLHHRSVEIPSKCGFPPGPPSSGVDHSSASRRSGSLRCLTVEIPSKRVISASAPTSPVVCTRVSPGARLPPRSPTVAAGIPAVPRGTAVPVPNTIESAAVALRSLSCHMNTNTLPVCPGQPRAPPHKHASPQPSSSPSASPTSHLSLQRPPSSYSNHPTHHHPQQPLFIQQQQPYATQHATSKVASWVPGSESGQGFIVPKTGGGNDAPPRRRLSSFPSPAPCNSPNTATTPLLQNRNPGGIHFSVTATNFVAANVSHGAKGLDRGGRRRELSLPMPTATATIPIPTTNVIHTATSAGPMVLSSHRNTESSDAGAVSRRREFSLPSPISHPH
eukprot:Rmarinus@m.29291